MNLAVVPSTTSGSPSSNAWPARSRHVTTRHILGPTSLRAFRSVLSSAGVRAYLPAPHLPEASGSAFPIKTGSEFSIGISEQLYGPRWQLKLARALPVSTRTIRYWLAGKRAIRPVIAERIRGLVGEREG
jgi:hypothetical protein